ERVGKPKRAGEEGALPGGQAIDATRRVVSAHEAVDDEVAFDGLHGSLNTFVAGWKKAHRGHQQEACVELACAEALHEYAASRIVAPLPNGGVNPVACRPPAFDGSRQMVAFDCAYGAIERDPGHHFRMRKLLRVSANLPNAVVGCLPIRFEEF